MVESDTIPDEFMCPINLEIMEDPVVAADGHSYERTAITLWLERNNTSPMTRKEFKNKDLFDNIRLRSLISQYKEQTRQRETLTPAKKANNLNSQNEESDLEENEEVNELALNLQKAIIKKKDLIDRIRITIIFLTDIKEDLEEHLHGCKISNTVGNSVSIASTPLVFTPFAVVGIGGVIAGCLTSLGTAITQHFIERSKLKKMREVLIEEEKAAIRYEVSEIRAEFFVETASVVSKGAMAGARIGKMVGQFRALQAARVANIARPAANIASGGSRVSKVLTLGKFSKYCAVAGVAISTLDIVLTWTMSNSTLDTIRNEIECRERTIEVHMKELEDMEKLSD